MATVAPPPPSLDYTPNRKVPPQVSSWIPNGGLPGETAVFKGRGFTNITAVDFGGIPAVFDVYDDSWFTAVLPNGISNATMHMRRRSGIVDGPSGFGAGGAGAKAWRVSTPTPGVANGSVGVNRVYNFAVPLPSDVTSVAVRGANRTFAAGAGANIAMDIAWYQSDGADSPTGAATATLSAVTLPGNGTFGSLGTAAVTRGVDGKAVMAHSFPNPSAYVYSLGTDNGVYADGTLVVNPVPAPSGINPNPNFWFNFGINTARRRVAVIADSIGGGYTVDSSVGFQRCAWNQLASTQDWAVNIQPLTQYGSLQVYADFAGHPYLWDQLDDILPNADVLIVQLGTNDLAYLNLGIMQASLQAIIAHAVSLGVPAIYAWTIPTQTGYADPGNIRGQYNTWLRANYLSLGLAGIYDAASAQSTGGVLDNSTQTAYYAGYVTVDNTHPSLAGQTQIAAGWLATIGHVPAARSFRLAFPIAYTTEVNGGSPTVYNRALILPTDVVSVVPRIRNAYSAGGVGSGLSCNLAHYTSDGSGGASGPALGRGALAAQSVPGDGTDYNGGAHSILKGRDRKIVQCQSLAAGATCSCSVTPMVHGTYSAGTSTVSPPPGVSGVDPTPITWNHYDIVTAKRPFVFITDSIGEGVNTSLGFENSFPYQLAAAKDYAVCQLSLAGSTLAQWAAFGSTSAAWWADGVFGADVSVWIQAMVNDVPGGTLGGMQAAMTAIVNHLRNDLGVTSIYTNTCTPNNSANEAVRIPWNAWLRANSLGLTAVADFAAAQNVGGMADNGAGTSFFAAFDSGDHLHPNDAGQNQMAAKCIATVG